MRDLQDDSINPRARAPDERRGPTAQPMRRHFGLAAVAVCVFACRAPAGTAPSLEAVSLLVAVGLGIVGLVGLGVLVAVLRFLARPAAHDDRVGRPAAGPAPGALPEAALFDYRTGARIPITRPTVGVGRDGRNEVVLPSGTVSANHARIEFRDRRFFVVDLHSTNGTFVNGQRITEPTALNDGDRIDFDEFRYQFVGSPRSVTDTLLRNAPVHQTRVGGAPVQPVAVTSSPPEVRRQELIEARASTHRLISCFTHRDRRAIERCVRCGAAGCEQCLTVTDDGPICRNCAARPTRHGPA